MVGKTWRKLARCTCEQLQLKATLTGGQSFRWKQCADGEYFGVVDKIVWLLRENRGHIEYKVLADGGEKNAKTDTEFYENVLHNYFRLDTDLEKEYAGWSKAHDHFRQITHGQFHAIRVLRQNPVENLFSFICSQNSHISRISTMVEKLCEFYGEPIGEFDGKTVYSFPTVETLAGGKTEQHLRANGFGYRARYIQASATMICDKGGLEWFKQLEEMDYKSARQELVSLTGIGPKVADCICLMSLNHLEAIPVDTHIYSITQKYYMKELKAIKSVTPKLYESIGDKFREVYGPMAGWAQTVLFCADLKQFQNKTS